MSSFEYFILCLLKPCHMLKIKGLLGSAYLSLGLLVKITFLGLGKTNTARLGKTEVSIFSKVGYLLKYLYSNPAFHAGKKQLDLSRTKYPTLCVSFEDSVSTR